MINNWTSFLLLPQASAIASEAAVISWSPERSLISPNMGLVEENKKKWKLSDFELRDILGDPIYFGLSPNFSWTL